MSKDTKIIRAKGYNHYDVVEELEERVKLYEETGFRPQGGASITHNGEEFVIIQTLTRDL